MESAIAREKAIQGWKSAWKLGLIDERNLQWHDLYEELEYLVSGLRRNDGSSLASFAQVLTHRHLGQAHPVRSLPLEQNPG